MAAEERGNPFVGPLPFERKDADVFFGRTGEVRELVSRIVANRVVVLYAPSGAGKTSLLNAGVLPVLESEEAFQILPSVRFSRVEAGNEPAHPENVYVSTTFSSWSEGAPSAAATRGFARLGAFLAAVPQKRDARGRRLPRIVGFDQFEEIFTAYPEHWEQREGFFEQLAEAIDDDRYLRVVLALREDYVAQLESLLPLLPSYVRFRLERLGHEGAIEAVTGPVARAGRSFAAGAAEALVEDLQKLRVDVGRGEPLETPGEFVEPVQLQVVCRSLWSELPDDVDQITAQHIHTSGDVDEVLRRFYEDAVRAAAEAAHVRQGRLRKWIESAFITSVGTRSTVYQGQALTAELPNAAVAVLEDRHLIRAERRAGARWYELTHDRFIGPIQSANASYRERRARKLRRAAIVAAAAIAAATATSIAAALLFPSRSARPSPYVAASVEGAVPNVKLGAFDQSVGGASRSDQRGYAVTLTVSSGGYRGEKLVLRATTLDARTGTPAKGGVVRQVVGDLTPAKDTDVSSPRVWVPLPTGSDRFRFRIVVVHGDRALASVETVSFTKTRENRAASVQVSITIAGPGNVTAAPTGGVCGTGSVATCLNSYSPGTLVSLNAVPDVGAHFLRWGGRCSGATPTCTLRPAAAAAVKASFAGAAPVGVALSPAAKIAAKFDPGSLKPYQRAGVTYIGHGYQIGPGIVHSGTVTIGGKKVSWSDRRGLTKEQADRLLIQELASRLTQVKSLVRVHLSNNQWQALADFTYNVGVGAFEGSTALKLINAGKLTNVPAALRKWIHGPSGEVDPRLVQRRDAEIALWNSP